ncbi:hypothetical protein KI387_034927, partial [Taxus chinensis]
MKNVCSLHLAIAEASKEYLDYTEFEKDMEKCLGMWNHATSNTMIPRGMEIAEAFKRFRHRILKTVGPPQPQMDV